MEGLLKSTWFWLAGGTVLAAVVVVAWWGYDASTPELLAGMLAASGRGDVARVRLSSPAGGRVLEVRTDVTRLFVYGTLRAGFGHPMQEVPARRAKHLGQGWVTGPLYDLGPYPGAVPAAGSEPDARDVDPEVLGDLYALSGPVGPACPQRPLPIRTQRSTRRGSWPRTAPRNSPPPQGWRLWRTTASSSTAWP